MVESDIIDGLRRLVKGEDVYFPALAELLYRHQCFYLLLQIKPVTKWAVYAQQILQRHRLILKKRYEYCESAFHYFAEKCIPYAVIKGAVLSQSAYFDESIRFSTDLDILVGKESVDLVKPELERIGFIQGHVENHRLCPYSRKEQAFYTTSTHQLAPFIKKAGEINSFVEVDVNFDVFWGEYVHKTNMAQLLAYTEVKAVCGVAVSCLLPEMQLLSLCLHNYKDMNSLYLLLQNKFRLSIFLDLYYLLKNSSINTMHFVELCKFFKAQEYVYYCLYYTALLFPEQDICDLRDRLFSEEGARLLNLYGLSENERKVWHRSFFDRLLFSNYREELYSTLTDDDWYKIQINRQFL